MDINLEKKSINLKKESSNGSNLKKMCPPVCLIGLLQREQKYKFKKSSSSAIGPQNDDKSSFTGFFSTHRTSPVTAIEIPLRDDTFFCGRDIYDSDTRQIICTWLFDTVDYIHHSRELVHIAMYCIDRYACYVPIESTYNLNLVAVATLSIVLKTSINRNSTKHVNYLDFFVSMSRNMFTAQDIIDMEVCLLNKLSWYVNPPTPQAFLEEFNQVWKVSGTFDGVFVNISLIILEVANYVVDCTLILSNFTNQPRSLIAIAALLLSMKDVKPSLLTSSMKEKAIEDIITYFQIGSFGIPNPLTFCEASDIAFEIESLLFDQNANNSVSSYKTLLSLYKAIDPSSYVYDHNTWTSNGNEKVYDNRFLLQRKRKSPSLVSP